MHAEVLAVVFAQQVPVRGPSVHMYVVPPRGAHGVTSLRNRLHAGTDALAATVS